VTIITETTYIAATIPAQSIYVSGATLFQIAEQYLGDALRWTELARLNGITDPWIRGVHQILIPPVLSSAPVTGILGA
jgi:nucleoid-associated protein YgaU